MNTETLIQQAAILYDEDFVAWTENMAQALEQRDLSAFDWENLVAEIRDLGKRDQRELESRLLVVLLHLLKWQYQPERRSYPGTDNDHLQNSWASSIAENRDQIQRLLKQSPSLQKTLENALESCYQKARKQASRETGLGVFCRSPRKGIFHDFEA